MLHDRRFAARERFGALRYARVLGWPFRGYDATRPMADCAERFLRQYTLKLWLLAAAALQLGWFDLAARLPAANLVLACARRNRIGEHFAWWTGCTLTDQRYAWKIEH